MSRSSFLSKVLEFLRDERGEVQIPDLIDVPPITNKTKRATKKVKKAKKG